MLEIKLTNLVKKYHKKEVLNIDSLTLKEGDVVGLIGANGAGKTTLAEIILGTKSQTSGTINYSSKNLRRNAVFQEGSFDSEVNLRYLYFFYQEIFQKTDQRDVKRQAEDFKKYGLIGLEHATFKSLSGGQKQRFKIMISMLNNPQLVLFDEVGNSLDLKTKKLFGETLIAKRSLENSIILIISHDPEEIYHYCTRVIKLDHQKIVFDCSLREGRISVAEITDLMECD